MRSAFYSFLQRFSLIVLGLANFMLLIRLLSKPQMGVWALFLSITTIFETSKSSLLKNAHIKYVSGSLGSQEKSIIASSSLLINSLISLIFIVVILFFSDLIRQWHHFSGDLLAMLTAFIPGLVFTVFFSHFEAIQQSHFDFKGVFAGQLIRQLTFFFIILFHFVFHIVPTFTQLAIYQSISIALGTLVIYLFSRKYLHHKFNPTRSWTKRIIGFGGFTFGSGLISNIATNLDQIMTAAFITSPVAVAYYNVGLRINGFIDIPTYAASEIIFPKMSQALAEEGHGKVKYLYERMVSLLLALIIPIALFVIIFPKLIINIIAGSQYEPAAPILQLYMVASIIGPIQNQAANVLNSIGKPSLSFYVNAFCMACRLGITYVCITNITLYGAAVGSLLTAILCFWTWYFVIRRQVGVSLTSIPHYLFGFYKMVYTRAIKIIYKQKNIAG
ncbi:MAG TPA: oligosaccharide flippase family protein [Puia sp.]|nr:oligosaccharide flippase family protein [Puia sp.]